jgi:hypothetical protein
MASVVIVLGHALMPVAPTRPRQDLGHGLLQGQDEPPPKPPHLRATQGGAKTPVGLEPLQNPSGRRGTARATVDRSDKGGYQAIY